MKTAIVWFRQDLRLADNPALAQALSENTHVIPLYIIDENLPELIGHAQQAWLKDVLKKLAHEFKQQKLDFIIKTGDPLKILMEMASQHQSKNIYWNRCYEPKIIKRDSLIKEKLKKQGIDIKSYNGSLLCEPWEILNNQQNYFKVFGYFWKKCYSECVKKASVQKYSHPEKLADFIKNNLPDYSRYRDFPEYSVTSRLSVDLHFGTISPWQIFQAIHEKEHNSNNESFLRELGWREFSYYLLYHFPDLPQKNFKPEFDRFEWINDKKLLSLWQKGQTGYPLVDAGMRELNETGYMHNRVRMITASFLTKHLLIDWRYGADWFLKNLVDADLANNSMNWQWVAGSGVDASPYFRIFNPILQAKKFDPQSHYIGRFVPEFNDKRYPKPIVDHDFARRRALAVYSALRQ